MNKIYSWNIHNSICAFLILNKNSELKIPWITISQYHNLNDLNQGDVQEKRPSGTVMEGLINLDQRSCEVLQLISL